MLIEPIQHNQTTEADCPLGYFKIGLKVQDVRIIANRFAESERPRELEFDNSYVYFLLNQHKIDKAVKIFKKQIDIVPDNANAHDSLGEELFKKGHLKESLAEYKRALQIEPNLENSRNKVDRII